MEQIEKYIVIISVFLTLALITILAWKMIDQYKKNRLSIILSECFIVLGGLIEIFNQNEFFFTLSDALEVIFLSVGSMIFLLTLLKILKSTSRSLSNYQMTLEITNEINSSKTMDGLFQKLIELCVRDVKNAESGSVVKLKKEDGCYVFVATVGYDLNKLKSIRIPKESFVQSNEDVKILQDIYQYDENLPTKTKSVFIDVGVDKIHSTLITKVTVNGETYGYFNLDSKKKNAFSENDLNSMRVLSIYLGTTIENAFLMKKLERMYNHDQLTGLYNRHMFDELEKMNWKTVTLFDVDNMKRINDSFGHETGDAVLKRFSQVLSSSCRMEDFAIRIGGDEFITVQRETAEDAEIIAHRILNELSKPFKFDGQIFNIHASYGIASFEEVGGNFQKALQRADERMYQLKNSSRHLERS